MAEDRDDLKEIILAQTVSHDVSTREGPAKVTIGLREVKVTHRFGGTKIIPLSADTLKVTLDDPLVLLVAPADGSKPLSFPLESPQVTFRYRYVRYASRSSRRR